MVPPAIFCTIINPRDDVDVDERSENVAQQKMKNPIKCSVGIRALSGADLDNELSFADFVFGALASSVASAGTAA